MNTINEQLKRIELYIEAYKRQPFGREIEGTVEILNEAADTIKALSAKLHAENTEHWIPIEEGFPPIGKPLAVTIKDTLQGKPNQRRYPVYYEKDSMKDGYHWSWRYGDFAYELIPDVSEVIAWQQLPEPYQPKEE